MIYWLASYPRSGNTWCRAFLTNLMREAEAPAADIGRLAAPPVPVSRDAFDTYLDIASSDLLPDEIDRMRRDFYRALAADVDAPMVLKLHCAFATACDGLPIFPHDATAGVVLIVRNPLDVAVSLADFLGRDLDSTIAWMADEAAELTGQGVGCLPVLPQRIGSWSSHGRSWLDDSKIPRHLVRYEDLATDPLAGFAVLASFLGLTPERGRLEESVRLSSFERLRAQEDADPGFALRNLAERPFFRAGRPGSWRGALTGAQRKRILRDHGEMMVRLGYIEA
jgi:hypothetical protein